MKTINYFYLLLLLGLCFNTISTAQVINCNSICNNNQILYEGFETGCNFTTDLASPMAGPGTGQCLAVSPGCQYCGAPAVGANFFMVDGFQMAGATNIIWQTNVNNIMGGMVYQLSFQTTLMDGASTNAANAFSVVITNNSNGNQIITPLVFPANGNGPTCPTAPPLCTNITWQMNQINFNIPSNGCITIAIIQTVFGFGGYDIGIDDITLTETGGYNYTVTPIIHNSCSGECNGSIAINVNGGVLPFSYIWTGMPGISPSSPDISSLCAGNYSLTISDANGCTGNVPMVIGTNPQINVSAISTTAVCGNGGNFNLTGTVSGGTGPYTYQWMPLVTGATGSTTLNYNCVTSGNYILTVVDALGCTAEVAVTTGNSCDGVFNPDPINTPIADQSCYWSTGGNSASTVDGNTNFLGTTAGTPLRLFTSGTDRVHIEAAGRVGVNTTAPTEQLDLNGNARVRNIPVTQPNCLILGTNVSGPQDNTLTRLSFNSNANQYLAGDGTWQNISTGTGTINNCGQLNFVTKDDGNGDLKCSQIFDNSVNVGVATTTPQYTFNNTGTSMFTYQTITNPYTTYNSNSNYPLAYRTTPTNNGLGIYSSETFEQDRMNIYANQNGDVIFQQLSGNYNHGPYGNKVIFNDRITGNPLNPNDMLVIDPAHGAVIIKKDYEINPPVLGVGAKLYVESGNSIVGGFPDPVGITAVNSVTNANVYSNSVAISGSATGVRVQGIVANYNIGGAFSGSGNWANNYGVFSVANQSVNNPSSNYGGYFEACGAKWNFGIRASVTANHCGSVTNTWAGYFDGNVNINGVGTITGGVWGPSDLKLKSNIKSIVGSLDILSKIKCYTFNYNYKKDEFAVLNLPEQKQYGVVAQELLEILPDLVRESTVPAKYDEQTHVKVTDEFDMLSVNYSELIPIIIGGIQEQQSELAQKDKKIIELEERMSSLESALASCCTNYEQGKQMPVNETDKASLEQNNPNPFTETTMIHYYIPSTAKNSLLKIYSINGVELKSIQLSGTGKGQVTFNGGELPSGTYVYNLVVDGKQVDSKWMTLTK